MRHAYLLAALGFLALLAACGGPRVLVSEAPPVASAVVNAPDFGDAHPVAWPGRAPSAYPVHGIDASRYQGRVDWPTAQRAGVSFAFIKATEGGDRVDAGFQPLWNGARAAGVPVGAYHFYYFCTSPEVQARWFIQNVPRGPGTLPPVLDLEWNHLSPTCQYRPPAEEVRRQARVWLDMVAAHYGHRPIIYTSPDFWEDNELWRLAGEELWLRAVTRHPSDHYGEARWSFWQYSGTGLVPGIENPVDLNAFAGSRAQWRAWLAARGS